MSAPTLPPGFLSSLKEQVKLEGIVTCVGFDDLLDVALTHNMPHVDHMVVITSAYDSRTKNVAERHGATVVVSSLFSKNDRQFNKGAAMNQGLHACQYRGWKLMLDADIVLPPNFRRVLQNHTSLDMTCIYGADRVNIVGLKAIEELGMWDQHQGNYLVMERESRPIEKRVVHSLYGYVPVGYFQLWHGDATYPYSKGTAEYDDVLFAVQWDLPQRRLLPTAVVYHLCPQEPTYQENWDGTRRQPRLDHGLTPEM